MRESRLDRIETALEAIVRSQAHLIEAQSSFEREHKNLLASQIPMQDELRRAQAEKRFERIETNLAEATDKLNAPIALMDRHVQEHKDNARPSRDQDPRQRVK